MSTPASVEDLRSEVSESELSETLNTTAFDTATAQPIFAQDQHLPGYGTMAANCAFLLAKPYRGVGSVPTVGR